MCIGRISPDQLLAVILPKIEAAREAKRRTALRQEVCVRVCFCFFGLFVLNRANPIRLSCVENNLCGYCSLPPIPIVCNTYKLCITCTNKTAKMTPCLSNKSTQQNTLSHQERDIHAIHSAALDAAVDAAAGNRSVGFGGDEFDMIERSPVYDDLICPVALPQTEIALSAGNSAAHTSNTGSVSSSGVGEQDGEFAASSSSSPRSEFVRRPEPAAAFERWERAQTAKEADRWAALPVVREVRPVVLFAGCFKGWCKTRRVM